MILRIYSFISTHYEIISKIIRYLSMHLTGKVYYDITYLNGIFKKNLFLSRSFSMNFRAEWLKRYLNTRNSFPTHTLFSEKLITQMVRKRWSFSTKNIYSWWCMSSWYDIEKNLFIRQVRRSWIVNRRELQKGLAFFINVHNWTVRWCQKYIPSSTLIYGKK